MNFSKEDWEQGLAAPPKEEPIAEEIPVFSKDENQPAEETVQVKTAPEKVNKPPKALFEWIEAAVAALIAISLIFAFVMRTVGVDGDSMNNTLLNGDRLLLSSYPYTPERGDIVVINRENDEPLIKRVIAVGGDTLDIDAESGKVILNGKELEEPYLDVTYTPRAHFSGEVVVPDDCIFVMGDNRTGSHDSRYNDIGFVKVSNVMGKALWRVAPIHSFGSIYSE